MLGLTSLDGGESHLLRQTLQQGKVSELTVSFAGVGEGWGEAAARGIGG